MSESFTKPVTDSEFEKEVLQSETPVLVDFWAEWCGPCRALGPVLEELAEQMQPKVKVLKINVDQNPSTPAKYGVRGIPTMILFKGGEEVEQLVGNQPKENIAAAINKHLS